MSAKQHFQLIGRAINTENGQALSEILSLPLLSCSKSQRSAAEELLAHTARMDLDQECRSYISDNNMKDLVMFAIMASNHVVSGEWRAAFKAQRSVHSSLLEYFKEENWVIPLMKSVSEDLRLLAIQSDVALRNPDNENLREAEIALKNGFTAVGKDRTPLEQPTSKKRAIFAVTNALFKIYFKLNTLHNCTMIINVIEARTSKVLDNLQYFPVCDVVTYKYYIGRLKMFEDDYITARKCLHAALMNTPVDQIRNRQRILASLIPVQMCCGIFPTEQVAKKYGFHSYYRLGQAAMRGDLCQFRLEMNKRQASFIRLGVFLVLERVKTIALRNLAKAVFLALDRNTRIPLKTFANAFAWQGELFSTTVDAASVPATADGTVYDPDSAVLDEVECLLSNLIFQDLVKGYINHETRTLILSKKNPFPTAGVVKLEDDDDDDEYF
jgi:nuclear mRNA export protein PCID2/THP1